jgi:aspartyl protease family protein
MAQDVFAHCGFAPMRSVIGFAAAAILAATFVPRYAAHLSDARSARKLAVPQLTEPAPPAPTNFGSVVVDPDASGHYRVSGDIDGHPLYFMIDTGASVVTLSAADAASLGIFPTGRDYTMVLRTANGTVRGAPTKLGRVDIGSLTVPDVEAVVMPDGALSDNLLGLSFLSRLRHFEFSQGRMVLEQ